MLQQFDLTFQDTEFGMGALPRIPDRRDYRLHDYPDVRAILEAGAPPSFDLRSYVRFSIYNQGSLPSCVAHSAAGMQSINEEIERNQAIMYDAVALYHAAGGNGSNG